MMGTVIDNFINGFDKDKLRAAEEQLTTLEENVERSQGAPNTGRNMQREPKEPCTEVSEGMLRIPR